MRAESKEPQAGHGAVTKAEQLAEGLDFEIWDGNRNIVRGKPPNRS